MGRTTKLSTNFGTSSGTNTNPFYGKAILVRAFWAREKLLVAGESPCKRLAAVLEVQLRSDAL